MVPLAENNLKSTIVVVQSTKYKGEKKTLRAGERTIAFTQGYEDDNGKVMLDHDFGMLSYFYFKINYGVLLFFFWGVCKIKPELSCVY